MWPRRGGGGPYKSRDKGLWPSQKRIADHILGASPLRIIDFLSVSPQEPLFLAPAALADVSARARALLHIWTFRGVMFPLALRNKKGERRRSWRYADDGNRNHARIS